jgi:hypothetical protein
MAGELVTVATFDLPPKARLAQNVLEQAGIKAVVTDENIVAMDWLFGNAVGWVKVQVLEEDAERAVAALEESLGPGNQPIDPEDLTAQAEAAGVDEGEEPPATAGESAIADRAVELAATAKDAGSTTSEAEPTPSERDEYARRMLLSTVFAVIFPPLWFYSIYLFLNAAFGEGPISARGHTRLLWGGAILGFGLLILFVMVVVIPWSFIN